MADSSYYCDVCDIVCSGIEPYVQHMKSNKHKKKEEQKKLLVSVDHAEKNFFCHTCEISCCGIIPYNQHMKSDKHLKKEKAKQLREKYLTSSSEPCSSAQNSENFQKDEFCVSSSEMVDQKGYNSSYAQNFRCVVCDKQFTGCVPYDQHMSGSAHKKKLQKIELLSSLNSGTTDKSKNEELQEKQVSSTSLSDLNNQSENSVFVEIQFKCDSCGEKFSSQEMYNLHLLSSVHRTEQKTVISEDDYFSSLCEKKFSGPVPFVQHMASNLHLKNIRKIQLFGDISDGKKSNANENHDDVENTNYNSMEGASLSIALRKLHNIGIADCNDVVAECHICKLKFYSNEDVKVHYESEMHYDNQKIYEYKKKVKVFTPEEPFNLST